MGLGSRQSTVESRKFGNYGSQEVGAAMFPQDRLFSPGGNHFCALRHNADQKTASRKSFFYLGSNFQRKGVEALRKIANVLQKVIVEDNRRDGDEKASGCGDQCFSDTWRDGAKAGGASISEAGKGVNDAPNGSEEADERSHGARSSQPGHAFFDATDFFRGSKLHADCDGLEAFQLSSGLRIAGADLAQEFAIAGGINGSKRRAR
jgi:hypothetical protein